MAFHLFVSGPSMLEKFAQESISQPGTDLLARKIPGFDFLFRLQIVVVICWYWWWCLVMVAACSQVFWWSLRLQVLEGHCRRNGLAKLTNKYLYILYHVCIYILYIIVYVCWYIILYIPIGWFLRQIEVSLHKVGIDTIHEESWTCDFFNGGLRLLRSM